MKVTSPFRWRIDGSEELHYLSVYFSIIPSITARACFLYLLSNQLIIEGLLQVLQLIIVPHGEWEKNPPLQAKTLVGPQGRKRESPDLIEGSAVVPLTLSGTRGFSWTAAKVEFIRLSEKPPKPPLSGGWRLH
jgi:hypothetical protein